MIHRRNFLSIAGAAAALTVLGASAPGDFRFAVIADEGRRLRVLKRRQHGLKGGQRDRRSGKQRSTVLHANQHEDDKAGELTVGESRKGEGDTNVLFHSSFSFPSKTTVRTTGSNNRSELGQAWMMPSKF